MHRQSWFASLVLLGVSSLGMIPASDALAAPSAGAPAPASGERVAGQLVVAVDTEEAAQRAAAALGAVDAGAVAPGYHLLRLPPAMATAASELRTPGAAGAQRLAGLPGVGAAYAPLRVHAAASANDPYLGEQRHLGLTRATTAWGAGATGSPAVRIAILDTAIPAHPDLPAPVASRDLLTGSTSCAPSVSDSEMGHGSHVAGIALATGNNAVGVAGITWSSSLVHGRVLDDCGSGSTADVTQGITWAADNGAAVINLSLGAPAFSATGDPDPALHAAIRYARSRGAVVVAAAGNAAPTEVGLPQYPAAYPEVIAVASTNDDGTTSGSSVRGPWVDLAAPGTEILSTLPNGMPAGAYTHRTSPGSGPGWGRFSGTSMSSPMVAGTAALLKAADPSLTAGQIEARLVRSARPVRRANGGTCFDYNGGILDVESARLNEVNAFGYRMATPRGDVEAFGDECYLGDAADLSLAGSIIGMATTPSRAGYWLVGSDGGIFTYGDAGFFGSTGAQRLNAPVIGMASTPSGKGYWLVAADGGIFTYGDAAFHGSTGGQRLNQPVIGMAATPTGAGYWLVAADGGIFAFGDAVFFGSTGDQRLVKPVLSLQSTPSGRGYWMVASDGGIFAYGDAAFFGSTGAMALNKPIIGMIAVPKGDGYWLVGADGGIFSFGRAPFFGSAGGSGLTFSSAAG